MFNKQGMVFYLASTLLTNGQYTYIYSSAVVRHVFTIALLIVIHTIYSFRVRNQKHTSLPTGKMAAPAE